jgi:hypothetical protein
LIFLIKISNRKHIGIKRQKKQLEEVLAGLGIEIPAQTRTKRVKGKMVTEQVDKINKKELLRMVREAVY